MPNKKCENLNFCENLKIWLEILNKKNLKYLNFCENLQIWLEILNKKNLKFWLQTTTMKSVTFETFFKKSISPYGIFFFREGNPPTCSEY